MRPIPPDTTRFVRVHHYGLFSERKPREYMYTRARTHTHNTYKTHTHTHTDGSRRADWNYGGKDRRFPMTVMITLRWKGVNRISKGRASLKSEPLNTVITSIRACVDFRAQKLAAVKVNSIEKRIAISIGNVNDLGLGYPAFRVSSCASPSLPQRISIYRFWWVDQWPTKSRRAQKFLFFFRRIARPRAEWFGHLLNAKRGVAVGGKMVWESTAAVAAAAAVGLTCCNHQTEKSSNRLLRRGASCRVDKFVFIETLPFPNPPITATSTAIHRLKLTYYTSAIWSDTNTHSAQIFPSRCFHPNIFRQK